MSVPIAIGTLIKAFHQDRFYWNVFKNEMANFMESNTARKYSMCKEVWVDNVPFTLIIDKPFADGYIYYGFGLESLPPNIKYISLYVKMECETTKSSFHKMIKISKSSKYHRKRLMKASDCTYFDQLKFNAFIKIGKIKHKME